MIRKGNGNAQAFTIVELLIVIVVIGILAAVTIIAFNGVQNKARIAGLQSTLESSLKQIENARTNSTNNSYPTTAPTELATGVNYYANANLGGFCASKTDNSLTYMITSTNTLAHTGPGCTATSLTNLITNPSFETSNANWVVAGNNTITRSTTYSANGTASGLVARTGTAAGTTVSIPMTTVAGTQYFVSYALRSVVGTSTITASVRNTTATGTIPADSSSQAIVPTTSFTRYTTSFTAEATTTYLVFDFTTTTNANSYAIDGVMAVAGDNAGAYVEPVTSPANGWTWTGTTNLSTSTGPAF